MTKEELKQTYSMRDILSRYGYQPNRAGFISCPFHQGDRSASLKVYEHDFHCFGCHENGDIFKFIMLMEDISFKEAFLGLGGTYQSPTFESRLAVYRAKKRRNTAEIDRNKKVKERDLNNVLLSVYQRYIWRLEPLSDAWCNCYNELQKQLYLHEIINGEEVVT